MQTHLYHASIGTVSGLLFHIGQTPYFTPSDAQAVYRIEDETALLITAEVEDDMAAFLA